MEDDEKPPHLPMDIIFKIPGHISDPATLARAASSYKPWRDIIKQDPTFLDGLRRRHTGHGFTSSLLLGFFYQESTEAPSHLWQHHEDKTRCLAPSFISTSEFIPFRGSKVEGYINAGDPMSLGTFLQGVGAGLNFYQPVASQDSYLALCHRSQDEEGRALPDVLCVCNPLSGDVLQIPSRRVEPPQHYVLLVTDDDDGSMSQSFRLVAIWIKGKKVIYRYYCSRTSAWWMPTNVPELMPGHYLTSSPAAASHGGGIYWLCGSWKTMAPAYVCTLNVGQEELVYLDLPQDAKSNSRAAPLLVASSADGGILLLLVKGLQMSVWKHGDEFNSNWVLSEKIDLTSSLPLQLQMMKHRVMKLRVEIFRGKSGAVVIWIEGEGLYLFFIGDRSMRKIDNENVTKKYCFCPYEIDWLSCLGITNLVVDGSLDDARKNIHRRWKALVAESIASK